MIELWPFVNGKALTDGLRLSSMEASDMLDVAHYYLESDFKASTPEEAEAHSRMREVIYDSMYSKKYKFAMTRKKSFDFDTDDHLMNPESDHPVPFDPATNQQKNYIPPTPVDEDSRAPFGEILDSPMN